MIHGIDGGMILRGVIGAFILFVVIYGAFRSSKPKPDSIDVFGDWPHMAPLDREWIGRTKPRCNCDRELRGA